MFKIEPTLEAKTTRVVTSRLVRTAVAGVAFLAFGMPATLWAEQPTDVPRAESKQDEPELGAWNYVLPLGIAIFQNFVFWGFGRLVTQTDYSAVDLNTIQRNFTVGFEWDVDAFPTNQLGHPYQGGLYFAAARASKLGYWTATLYTLVGSLQWEMFMENELPSYNDLVTTTFGGAAAGEVLYRLSSAILDPSASGVERAAREIAATVISPTVGLTRLVNGEILEDGARSVAPDLSIDLIMGSDRLREDGSRLKFSSMSLGVEIEYGDLAPKPGFEPFDWFRVTAY
jgi:hypothetical protein